MKLAKCLCSDDAVFYTKFGFYAGFRVVIPENLNSGLQCRFQFILIQNKRLCPGAALGVGEMGQCLGSRALAQLSLSI